MTAAQGESRLEREQDWSGEVREPRQRRRKTWPAGRFRPGWPPVVGRLLALSLASALVGLTVLLGAGP